MSGITWKTSPSAMAAEMEAYIQRVERATIEAAATIATLLEADAQRNAPWTDRSGDARARLFGVSELAGDLVQIYLSHGDDEPRMKSIALELANAERYAVIMPTIMANLDQVFVEIATRLR